MPFHVLIVIGTRSKPLILQALVRRLLELGAIHTCPVSPDLTAGALSSMQPEQIERAQAAARAAREALGIKACLFAGACTKKLVRIRAQGICMNWVDARQTWTQKDAAHGANVQNVWQGMLGTMRAAEDFEVNELAYIRVHIHPKRFPKAAATDWLVCGTFRPLLPVIR